MSLVNLDAAAIANALPWNRLIDGLATAFAQGASAPMRGRHVLDLPNDPEAVLLTMPAWNNDFGGVKLVTVFPSNAREGRGMVAASYALFCAKTGSFVAVLDGEELTLRRTAAVAALAASHLARPDAVRLLVVGTGRLAERLPAAYSSIRSIRQVTVWGRTRARAERCAGRLRDSGFDAEASSDLRESVGNADIIATATGATEPLLHGDWLCPGVHLDLLGSFRPHMTECDDATLLKASRFAETERAVLAEAGEFAQAQSRGLLLDRPFDAELADLTSGRHPGRQHSTEITLFKSVGHAVEDLTAASLAYRQHLSS